MNRNQVKAVALGSAIGDALGVPVEFVSRKELLLHPVTDMTGFGTYPFPAGSWSDDTSMALAAMESLLCGKVDFDRVMVNFGKWYYRDEFTPTGKMFDCGATCSMAIDRYFIEKKPIGQCGLDNEQSNGNGSLMRIYPFILYAKATGINTENMLTCVRKASALTHAHRRSQIGCGIYALVLSELLDCPEKASIGKGLEEAKQLFCREEEIKPYRRLFQPDFLQLSSDGIYSSGYVVDTLEAALWCLMTTNSYPACVLKAVNLGEDTDTVAAVSGGLAGAMYGLDALPQSWKSTLLREEMIERLCEKAGSVWLPH